jgi:hypothetical protein
VSLEHTLFLDFLKLFVNMRLKRFVGKKNAFLGPTDQKLWMFEVSSRSLGRAGMCWSQPTRVDHLRKKWTAGRKKLKWKEPDRSRRRPAAGGRLLVAGCGSTPRPVMLYPFKFIFILFYFKRIFGSLGNGPGLLGEWVYSIPIFEACPYT